MSPTSQRNRHPARHDVVAPCLRGMLASLLLLVVGGSWLATPAHPEGVRLRSLAQATGAPAPPPGKPASAQTTGELQRVLADAIARFQARDAAGVLAHVSEQYKTSPMTKRLIRDQLTAMFALYDTVRAKVRIDDVRMVGEHAWVWSTGEVEGRLVMVNRWMPVLSWEKELEVARREDGRWRLYGYQQ